jgi:hypothetical protein
MGEEIKSRMGYDILKIVLFMILLILVVWLFFFGGFYSIIEFF